MIQTTELLVLSHGCPNTVQYTTYYRVCWSLLINYYVIILQAVSHKYALTSEWEEAGGSCVDQNYFAIKRLSFIKLKNIFTAVREFALFYHHIVGNNLTNDQKYESQKVCHADYSCFPTHYTLLQLSQYCLTNFYSIYF